MKTTLKLFITIDITEGSFSDPTEDFFKAFKAIKAPSIKKLSYEILSQQIKNQDCEKAIIENGVTPLVMPEGHLYATGTPYDRQSDIIITFHKFLDRIILSDHLILIDPYLFYPDDNGEKYSEFVVRIFQKYLKRLNKITFVTRKGNYKKRTCQTILDKFSRVKSKLKLDVKYTNLFHDRIWLCDDRGMFIGTSLNGMGQSYCLIDYIQRHDILDIKGYLAQEKLF